MVEARLKGLSWCEPVWVGGATCWCLRPLTDKGQKLGGSVDTNSLCGRVQAPYGWDVAVPVTLDRVQHPRICCPRCRDELMKLHDV
jgi:hypothetical protein